MKYIVTGSAGFIGSTLTDRLLNEGHTVIGIDNFSTGQSQFLEDSKKKSNFHFHQLDLLTSELLEEIFTSDVACVFHLAANADVKEGFNHPRKDLEQNTLVTWNVLEAMRKAGIPKLVFSSTGSIYGEAEVIPTSEKCPFPIQTSLYGASKLAAEGLISAYAEGYGIKALIFRFVSILGERYTHGHIFDFIQQLQTHPGSLSVLGNGKQKKSYLYIGDCIEAILLILQYPTQEKVSIYNLGTDAYVEVNQSIEIICKELHVKPKIHYLGGERGWIGDNPFIFLDCTKIRSLGWRPLKTIPEGIQKTIHYLLANPWVLESRK